ncbi:TlpA disulfide reductase family protein [Methylobacterium mesophilicum]
MASALGLVAPPAAANELPVLRGSRGPFVLFEPQPTMLPLALLDLQGRPAILAASRRDVQLLYVWATWCPACPVELPRLARDQVALAPYGVTVSTISIDARPAADVSTFLRRHDVTGLRVLHDPDGVALSAERPDGTSSPFQRWSMPLTFVVDRMGNVRGYVSGSVDWLRPEGRTFLQALRA